MPKTCILLFDQQVPPIVVAKRLIMADREHIRALDLYLFILFKHFLLV